MRINKKSGFTLIEIIVVLIIVGVLAAIALPNLFSNIAKSKGAEATATMGSMKATIEGCGQKNGGVFTSCDGATIGVNTTSGLFTYTLGVGANSWTLNAVNGAVGTVSFARAAAGTITCSGTGSYQGVC